MNSVHCAELLVDQAGQIVSFVKEIECPVQESWYSSFPPIWAVVGIIVFITTMIVLRSLASR